MKTKKYGRWFVLLSLLVCAASGYADDFPNTQFYDADKGSPEATIAQAAWIAGIWRGEIWGGQSEEIWSEPLAGAMMGSFRFVEEQGVKFYELITITEEEGSLILKLKHFHPNLHGWEEKNETVDFRLVSIDDTHLYFDGYTYERVGADEMNVYVVIDQGEKKVETKFQFKRLSDLND